MGIDLNDLPESARTEAARQIRAQDRRGPAEAGVPANTPATEAYRDTWHGMNRWEREYGLQLNLLRMAGDVQTFAFEAVTFRLTGGAGDRCSYTPDYQVWMKDGAVEYHEVKGFVREDALVKFKVARSMFPMFRFRMFRKLPKKEGGGWKEICCTDHVR